MIEMIFVFFFGFVSGRQSSTPADAEIDSY